jgi:hypothetical protein
MQKGMLLGKDLEELGKAYNASTTILWVTLCFKFCPYKITNKNIHLSICTFLFLFAY